MKVLSIRVGESQRMLQPLLDPQRCSSQIKGNFSFLFLFAEDILMLAKAALLISNTDPQCPDPKPGSSVVQMELPQKKVREGISCRQPIALFQGDHGWTGGEESVGSAHQKGSRAHCKRSSEAFLSLVQLPLPQP